MNKMLVVLVVVVGLVNMGIIVKKITKKEHVPPVIHEPVRATIIPVISPVHKPIIPQPEIQNYPLVRSLDNSLGKVLSDIDAHMPAGHIYRDNDRITWSHETTHGINSNIRQKFSGSGRINGFYVLENRAIVVKEPATTIRAVAARVPNNLRGGVYNLYLVSQAGAWNDTPLYLCDEHSGYLNGSACRLDLGIISRSETVQYMLEFNVYISCIPWTSGSDDPQLKSFLMFQIDRAMKVYKDSVNLGNLDSSNSYLEKMRTGSDATQWRGFCKQYYGSDWCRDVLGF